MTIRTGWHIIVFIVAPEQLSLLWLIIVLSGYDAMI
jgi:hypothetical protein